MRRVHLLVRETQGMKTMTVAAPKTKSSAAEIWPSLRCGNRHSRLHRHWRSNSRLRISGCARSDRPDVPLRAILKLGQRLGCEFVLRLVACPEIFAQALWLVEQELDGARLIRAWPSVRPALAHPDLLPALTGR